MVFLVIVLGLVWGSFLSVIKNRLDDFRSVLVGRSRCPKCHHPLGLVDLIPLVSFIIQGGRCRYCHAKISLEYPLLEIFTAGLAVIVYLKVGFNWQALLLFSSLSALEIACFLDIQHQEVELSLLMVGIILALIWRFSYGIGLGQLEEICVAVLICGFVPFMMYAVSHEKWMGLGDSFFAIWVGVLSGFPAAIISIFSAFLIGAIFGIIILTFKLGHLRDKVPFGPFVSLGGIIGLLFGNQIIAWYLNLIGF